MFLSPGVGSVVMLGWGLAVGTYETRTALVSVEVPAGAQVWIDDQPTRQTGTVREFRTPWLAGNIRYSYTVRARWRAGDRDVEQFRRVSFAPGARVAVSFLVPEQTDVPRPVQPIFAPPGLGISAVPVAPAAGATSNYVPYVPPALAPGGGYSPPGTGVFPYSSGYSPGGYVTPGTGVYPSTSGYRPPGISPPGTGVFPSTSGYRGR